MKRIITSFTLAILLGFGLTAQSRKYVTLMTYNIHNAIGMDGTLDTKRIADVIRKCNPDVAAIQEIDSVTNRSGHKYVLGEIAANAGMHASFAHAIKYDGGKYGIGIVSKSKPLSIRSFKLPGREEERAIIVAEFNDYIFACTHLSLTTDDRITSLEIIDRIAREANKPFFVAGDLNATPQSDVIKQLQQRFNILNNRQCNTFPSPKPTGTIDYIASYKDSQPAATVTVIESQVIDEKVASDHRPVVVQAFISTQRK